MNNAHALPDDVIQKLAYLETLRSVLGEPAYQAARDELLAQKKQDDTPLNSGDDVARDQNKAVIQSMTGTVVVGNGTMVNPPPDPAAEEARRRGQARAAYLRALRATCQALPLAALGEDDSAGADITLEQVYIDLNTTARVKIDPEMEPKKGKKNANRIGREPKERDWSALEAASAEKRLVLLGDPGSGKSTFVHYLLAWQAAAGLGLAQPVPGFEPGLTPVLVTLRELAPRLPEVEGQPASRRQMALLAALYEQIRVELLALRDKEAAAYMEDLFAELTSGNCLLVLDGLDEVPIERRERVRSAALAATRLSQERAARVIVTCRSRSYSGEGVFSGFATYTLAPFDENQIRGFAHAWYNTQLKLRKIQNAEQAEQKADNLTGAALALRELAANPMLLTSMAIIHQREIGLPDQRVELYSQVVELLARRWQQHRSGEETSPLLREFLKDGLRLRAALECLGYAAHRASAGPDSAGTSGDLERMEALRILEGREYLGNLAAANEFMDYVDQRSGLLMGRGGEPGSPATYGFPHRSLQEYLAGCWLMGQRDVLRGLYQHAGEGEGWDLAVQLGLEELYYNRRGTNLLLDLAYRFCDNCAGDTPQQQRGLLWSGQIAALVGVETIRADTTWPNDGPHYLARIRTRLVQVLGGALPALERVEAGNALAKLGDPRFRAEAWHLPDEPLLGFVQIPAGTFCLGSDPEQDPDSFDDEQPQHSLELGEFFIARYPVTVAQYRAFVEESDYQTTDQASLNGIANHPVIDVTWHDALSYCAWLTKKLAAWTETPRPLRDKLARGWQVTLPTEAQWERAARGGDGRNLPWGEKFNLHNANTIESSTGGTSPVGGFPGGNSAGGLVDLSGNVWEWTRNIYKEYPYDCADGREDLGAGDDKRRVLRGGSWHSSGGYARCAFRDRLVPSSRLDDIGFRVVVCPLPPSEL